MNVLLAEPEFPIPPKSKNHRDFLPIGLLKLASYHKQKGDNFRLVRGNKDTNGFVPDEVKITSLFTYWSQCVWDSVAFYKEKFPNAKVIVGGIYASLMPEHCRKSGCDEVFVGVNDEAEKYQPAYDLVDVDYQIIHASRGCIRRCDFCGTWKIEPTFTFKRSIREAVHSNRLIFYDNNLLANPNITDILLELSEMTYDNKPIYAECQCGLDGRLLNATLAKLLKKARFINPRIAWDHGYSQYDIIKKQIDMLVDAGYQAKDIYVFMIYNWNYDFLELEKKRLKCWEWKVQIADCRYRPLEQVYDYYNPKKEQTIDEYYIHPKWIDNEIKQFRKNVRRQNICVRHGFSFYSKDLEQKRVDQTIASKIKTVSPRGARMLLNKGIISDYWYPDKTTHPSFPHQLD
ncbi:hypothetical protein ES703_52684 [subsurface metagenome]